MPCTDAQPPELLPDREALAPEPRRVAVELGRDPLSDPSASGVER
jgi:hypothetical protein